jgi:hypothetical protein
MRPLMVGVCDDDCADSAPADMQKRRHALTAPATPTTHAVACNFAHRHPVDLPQLTCTDPREHTPSEGQVPSTALQLTA